MIVDADGQSSAYYTCLLRLYGFNNVYTLNFGMAYWNINFSDIWLQKIHDAPNIQEYNDNDYPKGPFADLPFVSGSAGNIIELAKQRIASFITRGFVDKINNILEIELIPNPVYVICYGTTGLYFAPDSVFPPYGHPPEAILYLESKDLRTVDNLQTLPTNEDILVYDYSGQLSSAVVAYLQVMGYKVKTLLYGACQMVYNRISIQAVVNQFVFIPGRISNFPYVTGE